MWLQSTLPSAWVQCFMVPSGLYVTFCAEAHAGIQVSAIPEDRMKVMRRMEDLPLDRALTARPTIYSHISGGHHCEVGHTGRFCRRLLGRHACKAKAFDSCMVTRPLLKQSAAAVATS